MRKSLLIYIIMCAACAYAAKKFDCKAVVQVVSFSEAGDTLSRANGFFTSAEGDVVVSYDVLKGASRVEVTDWKGKTYQTLCLLGANKTYNLARIKCAGKKFEYLPMASVAPTDSMTLQQAYYSASKKAVPTPVSIVKSEDYKGYKFLTISTENEANYIGCPVLNENGEAVAVVQRNPEKNATQACAIDVRFAKDLQITTSSVMDADMRAIHLRRELPLTEDAAYSYLYLLGRVAKDSVEFENASTLFKQRYPKNAKALTEMAYFYASHNNYSRADEAIASAFACTESKDEVHSALADIIYQKALYAPQPAYKDWELSRALTEAEAAYAIKPDTTYIVQQAHCLYGLERYQEASGKFVVSAEYSKQPAEMYFYAANALERAKGDSAVVLSLLDKAVNVFMRPYTPEAAPYLLTRAQHLEQAGKFRAAVQDYNEYEKAVGAKNLTARFYDIRQAAAQQARMYQQAIDDLHTAAAISTTDNERGLYYTEVAYIYLQVGMNQEAIDEANIALKYMPGNTEILNCISFAKEQLTKNK